MQAFEQTLDSREVAEMVDKKHKFLMRDIRRYINQIAEGNEKYGGGCKVAPSDFFTEGTYRNSQNKELPCYRITKKGCEFIAHKLTGTKGTIFTARYINRFHEMEEIINKLPEDINKLPEEQDLPWFIRRFLGEYVVLERDFIKITGIDIKKDRRFYNESYFTPGVDWNGFGEKDKCDADKFKQEYGFEYGEDSVLIFLLPCGVLKALSLLADGKQSWNPDAYNILASGLKMLQKPEKKELEAHKSQRRVISRQIPNLPININIIYETEKA